MSGPRSGFTPEEDAIILSYIKKADENPDATYSAMYPMIAEELNRDVDLKKIQNRAYTLRKSLREKSLTDKDKILLKLRSITRDQKNTYTKVNHYKEKFNALKKEHESLKKDYDILKKEHEEIMSVLQEVLGENEGNVVSNESWDK